MKLCLRYRSVFVYSVKIRACVNGEFTAFYAFIEVRKYCIIFGEKADLSIIIRALSAFIKHTKRIFREFYLG